MGQKVKCIRCEKIIGITRSGLCYDCRKLPCVVCGTMTLATKKTVLCGKCKQVKKNFNHEKGSIHA